MHIIFYIICFRIEYWRHHKKIREYLAPFISPLSKQNMYMHGVKGMEYVYIGNYI